MFVVIAYDTPSDKRRRHIVKILMDYGNRVQYSVFEAKLPQELLIEMRLRLERVIDQTEDSIRIYKLCETCLRSIKLQGTAKLALPEEIYVF
jgi:CRISPR-associated protein Cas2